MSGPSPSATPSPEGRTRLPLLVDEATRQLDICNACRYCEGLCAVFPALSRRTVLSAGDVSQLASLCHDCRACYDACMYTAPHEFDLNVPAVLTEVRLADYQRYVWPARVPGLLRGWTGLFTGALASAALFVGIAAAHAGWPAIVAAHDSAASPYRLIPDGVLVGLMLAAIAYGLLIGALAARSYWAATGSGDVPVRPADVLRATWYALTLRYLRGGGVGCYYPADDKPSPARRYLHLLTVAGFGLCVVSTAAAAVLQDILGEQPPYAWLSAPVISGTIGGIGLLAGCAGLLLLKARSSRGHQHRPDDGEGLRAAHRLDLPGPVRTGGAADQGHRRLWHRLADPPGRGDPVLRLRPLQQVRARRVPVRRPDPRQRRAAPGRPRP